MTSHIWTIRRILEGVRSLPFIPTLIGLRAFDLVSSPVWWEAATNILLLAYGLPKENVAAIMMLYKNTKVKVHSPDGDTTTSTL